MKAVRHFGITITDREKSLRFYRDLLGLKIVTDTHEEGKYLDNMSALQNVKVNIIKMAADDGNLIELLCYKSHPRQQDLAREICSVGPTHAAFTVANLDEVYETLTRAGVIFNAPPQLAPCGRFKVTFCKDPDGTLIELVEKLKEDKAPEDLFSVKGKVILITGGGGGLGGKIVTALAERGAIVYVFDISFPQTEEEAINNPFKLKCDITDVVLFKNHCANIFGKHGHIDALINCAGIAITDKDKNSEIYPREYWDKTLDINLSVPFACSQAVFEYMARNQRGSIINITSLGAERGFPHNPAYGASKGGLKILTKCLARDWGKFGIRVNNVVPGYMGAGMTEKTYANEKIRTVRSANTMLGRWGSSPEDMIGPVIFLISDASSYITGADIFVDGGWLANGLPDLDGME